MLLAVLAACSTTKSPSSTGKSPSPGSTPTTAATGSGPVNVYYAGSLAALMTNQVGPEFKVSTGYTFNGTAGDSGTLENEILAGQAADVFISASPAKNTGLMGSTTGTATSSPRESWYATWATSPVVFAFASGSSVSTTLESTPWYQVLTNSKFKVGRTDPVSDPTAVLADEAVTMTAAAMPSQAAALNAFVASNSNKYGETELPAEIEAGQLDAGFVYQVEAKQQGLSYVPLTVPNVDMSKIHATYTIS
ncbi:MAG: substrate-binding domain-containing protein, partial [Actinomycetota bacterium]